METGCQERDRANKSVEHSRRPASRFNAEGHLRSAQYAPTSVPAAVAHLSFAMIRAVVIASLVILTNGCRTGGLDAKAFHSWGSEDAKEFRARLDHYRNVLLVCVYQDHWEDRGPNRYSLFHAKATVVRVYKGDWHVSERIAWMHGLDDRAPASPKSADGGLFFVFTNQHTDAEIGLDTGEFTGYSAEHALALERIYPQ